MADGIHKPSVKTYFITKNGSIHYGIVNPNQVMDSGLPNQETFTDKELWLDRLFELGVTPLDCVVD
jgi:hypothetical protein